MEVQIDLMSLIARNNKSGKMYRGGRNLVKQTVRKKEAEDLFLDGGTRAKKQFETARLGGGINFDEE
jgi:hypothetical protein